MQYLAALVAKYLQKYKKYGFGPLWGWTRFKKFEHAAAGCEQMGRPVVVDGAAVDAGGDCPDEALQGRVRRRVSIGIPII